ncbi:hypothetical protein CfE428DRAFT_5479 [Chthoniobacter flavus Ellin428]|uniref:Uncharacterized protein n=1 Tax=Chthoniobacter flavus Ellin428 TaxID=497964 RepID=B4D989_9BACT|nr:hypothetical protein CfE428DRAFT_5479 [Chthoniobacter flavus Ellin428]
MCHPERSEEAWAESKDLQFLRVLVRSLRTLRVTTRLLKKFGTKTLGSQRSFDSAHASPLRSG